MVDTGQRRVGELAVGVGYPVWTEIIKMRTETEFAAVVQATARHLYAGEWEDGCDDDHIRLTHPQDEAHGFRVVRCRELGGDDFTIQVKGLLTGRIVVVTIDSMGSTLWEVDEYAKSLNKALVKNGRSCNLSDGARSFGSMGSIPTATRYPVTR